MRKKELYVHGIVHVMLLIDVSIARHPYRMEAHGKSFALAAPTEL